MTRASLIGLLAALACENGVTNPVPVTITAASVAANPANVLSALVEATFDEADSARVSMARGSGEFDAFSAPVIPGDAPMQIPVLGLFPDQAYRFRIEAFRDEHRTISPELAFTTGSLPVDLPTYTTTGSDADSGFVIFAAGKYLLAIDNTGRVAWYHRFEAGA